MCRTWDLIQCGSWEQVRNIYTRIGGLRQRFVRTSDAAAPQCVVFGRLHLIIVIFHSMEVPSLTFHESNSARGQLRGGYVTKNLEGGITRSPRSKRKCTEGDSDEGTKWPPVRRLSQNASEAKHRCGRSRQRRQCLPPEERRTTRGLREAFDAAWSLGVKCAQQ